jgi:Ni,Fe-hydrogenase III small subunit/ferredoxin
LKKRDPLWAILTTGRVTQRELFPDLPEEAAGLPMVTQAPCEGAECRQCAAACPTEAITVTSDSQGGVVALDRGRCIGCSACIEACPTGTLAPDRSTRVAVRSRADLVFTNRGTGVRCWVSGVRTDTSSHPIPTTQHLTLNTQHPFRRSLHIREVSTGCNATDLEVAAANNPIFDAARFGIQFVASPRFADALLVTGPVGRAMQEPLRRCFEAMAEPRFVIAMGTCAISGGVHRGGYAEANGVPEDLPVAAYVPGCPPHPWSIIHGILIAMGRDRDA